MSTITRRSAILSVLAGLATTTARAAPDAQSQFPTPAVRDGIMEARDSTVRFMADLHSGKRIEGQTYLFNKRLQIDRPDLLDFHDCEFIWVFKEPQDVIVSFDYHIAGKTDQFTEVNRFRTVLI